MQDADFVALASGHLNPMAAFFARGALATAVAMDSRIMPPGGKHWVQRKGNKERNEHRKGNRDSERKKEPPDNPLHVCHRDKHRQDRHAGCKNCQTDFTGAEPGGLHVVLAHRQVSDDILPNHNGIVNQQANRQRQGHESHDV